MIGASNFGRTTQNGHPALTFTFKGSRKVNYVIITLMPSDTYSVQFRRGMTMRWHDDAPIAEYHDIYAEQLKPLFERVTGLYLSL